MADYLVPIAISSQLDVTGEERIHAAKYTPTDRPYILLLTGDLVDGLIGDEGTYQYTVVGTYPPFTVTLVSGELPDGADIDENGLVTYLYTTAGLFTWQLQVEDAMGNIATLDDAAEITDPTINMFVAVSSNGEIASSEDGITWSLITDTNSDLRRIDYCAGRWITTSGAASKTYTSEDGITWTMGTLSSPAAQSFHLLPVVANVGGGYLIGLDRTNFYSSPDGVTWTSDTIASGSTGMKSAATNDNIILFGDNDRTIWKSTDSGATWNSYTVTTFSSGTNLNDLLYSDDDGIFVTVSLNNGTTSVATSLDGQTWTGRGGGSSQKTGIAYGDGTYVIVGPTPSVSYSTSILTSSWNAATHPFVSSVNDVAYGLIGTTPTFVAVGASNAIAYSTDGGVTWSSATSPFTSGATIRSVAFGTAYV